MENEKGSKLRVFVSSTFLDLKEYRQAAMSGIRQLALEAVGMEDYVAEDKRLANKCQDDVETCDIYVGIFAWRYGTRPRGDDNPNKLSITELEYEKALESNMPRFAFRLDPAREWPIQLIDEDRTSINALHQRINDDRVATPFTSPADLKGQVIAVLQRHLVSPDGSNRARERPRDPRSAADPGAPSNVLNTSTAGAPAVETTEVYIALHDDAAGMLTEVRPHLSVLEQNTELRFWDPSQVRQLIAEERAEAVARAKKAIVLISKGFLSDTILRSEVVELLSANVPLYCVHVEPTAVAKVRFTYRDRKTGVERTRYLPEIKPVNEPERALLSLPKAARERVFVDLVEALVR